MTTAASQTTGHPTKVRLSPPRGPATASNSKRKRVAAIILSSVCLGVYYFRVLPYLRSHLAPALVDGNVAPFSWDNIEPSEALKWHPCFPPYFCARLSVPLDWNSTLPNGGPRLALAVVKRPAAVEVWDPQYGGPVIFNPGGPGNSGVNFLFKFGSAFATFFDPEIPLSDVWNTSTSKYFDLISFDPRGVNNTTPHHNCIASPSARAEWKAQQMAVGLRLSDPEIFAQVFAREKLYGELCSDEKNGGGDPSVGHIGQYVSTANVVRDMVELVERHGEWREKVTDAAINACDISPLEYDPLAVVERTRWRQGKEQLQYWGFSYGTVLGQVFATMQPHRVKRMILDGNVDVEDYLSGFMEKNLEDVDKITERFGEACFMAGPDRCKVWEEGGPERILTGFHKTLEQLKTAPMARIQADGLPEVVTYSTATSEIYSLWYNAYYGYTEVANMLAEIRSNNGSGSLVWNFDGTAVHDTKAFEDLDREAPGLAIRCTDGEDITSMTESQFKAYVSRIRKISALFGEGWSTIKLPCVGYRIRSKWRFTGPVGAQTANPILFLNGWLDPVTPLSNAVANSKLFPGSKVLTSDATGHCTVSMPSPDVLKFVRNYLTTGEVYNFPHWGYSAGVGLFDVEKKKPESMDERVWEGILSLAEGFPRALH